MKVRIRKYPTWMGPYKLVEKLCFWANEEKDEYGFPKEPEWVYNLGDKLAHSWLGHPICYLASAWTRFHEKRRVKVQIDRWDTWNMYQTVGHIVLPMLKQLKETKHGSPIVDLEDVPEELRLNGMSRNESMQYDLFADAKYDNLVWNMTHQRWEWVLSEMIFSFESIVGNNEDWEEKYHTGEIDRVCTPVDVHGNEVDEEDAKFFRWDKGPNDTSEFDTEGYKKEAERIANGFRLFGKYYQGLWD